MRRIDEIRERLDKATPGPWVFGSAPAVGSGETPADYLAGALTGYGPLFVVWVPSTEGNPGGYVLTAATGDGPHASQDAELISNAPADLAWLLGEVERLSPPSGSETTMSEREEYTPPMDEIKRWYSGAVGEYWCDTGMSEEDGEMAFDRAIAAHDRALREQIADDLRIEALNEDPDIPNAYREGVRDGLMRGVDIARGEGSE